MKKSAVPAKKTAAAPTTPAAPRGRRAAVTAAAAPPTSITGMGTAARLARARALAAEVTKSLKGKGRVDVGADIAELEYERILTGHFAIDFVTNGGLIRGRISEFWGLEASSKTTSCALIVAHLQRQGMLCAIAPIEGIDKAWWRTLGCFIPYSAEEMAKMEASKRASAERYNHHYAARGVPPLTVIQHKAGDHTLQLVYEWTKANLYDLIVVDSLGAVKSSRILEDKTLVDNAEYGGEANLFNNFCRFMFSALNTRYNSDGDPDESGIVANRTAVVCINQARQTIGTMARAEHNKYHATGGQALRHAWSQSIFFSDVEDYADQIRVDARFTQRDVYAKMFAALGTKMRGGPEGRKARYVLHIKQHTHDGVTWKAGQLDNPLTVRMLAVQLGVVVQAGSSYSYNALDGSLLRWRGKEALEIEMRSNPTLYEELYRVTLERAIEESHSGTVPELEE